MILSFTISYVLLLCHTNAEYAGYTTRNLVTLNSFNVNVDPVVSQCRFGYNSTNGLCVPDTNITRYSQLRCRAGFNFTGSKCVATNSTVACKRNFVWSSSSKRCIYYGDGVPTPSASASASPQATTSTTASPTPSRSSSTSATISPSATNTISTSVSPSSTQSPMGTASTSVSSSPTQSSSGTISSSVSSSTTQSPLSSFSTAPSSTASTSSSVSPTSLASMPSASSLPSSSSAASSTTSTSSLPSYSSISTTSATSTSSLTSTSTASGTSTSTLRKPDLQSSTPSPRPIVNVALTFEKVQLSLFYSGSNDQILTSLVKAVASAVGAAPAFVAIRRVRDFTYPLTPTIIWTNPLFAGDTFNSRRLTEKRSLQSGMGSVNIDFQITLTSNAAAASLTSNLAKSTAKLTVDIKQALVDDSSPLSSSQISATVEPYTGGGSSNDGGSSTPLTGIIIPVAAGVVLVVSIVIGYTCYRIKKQHSSTVAVAPEDVTKPTERQTSMSRSSNWTAMSTTGSSVDARVTVERVLADHEINEAEMMDNLASVKAMQEANLQERIAQREVMKARVARKKAEEYKALKERGINLPGSVV